MYQLLIFLNLFIVYLFKQRDCQKNLYQRAAHGFFISPGRWIGNKQLFKIGLKIPVFRFFEKLYKGQLKIVNVSYQKWPDLAIFLV